tara:strand:- start:1514 stop:1933 length:420 start_codon:yes stop_codon:yes gene_type:complete
MGETKMTFNEKIKEYKDHLEALNEIDSLEVYQWLIGLGKRLNDNPLDKDKHTEDNRVSRCQYDLFVDKEDDKYKAWSNAMIAGGYAYILVDIFNSMTKDESEKITVEDFKKMKLDEMLTMNRQTGFYQMIEMMLNKGKK